MLSKSPAVSSLRGNCSIGKLAAHRQLGCTIGHCRVEDELHRHLVDIFDRPPADSQGSRGRELLKTKPGRVEPAQASSNRKNRDKKQTTPLRRGSRLSAEGARASGLICNGIGDSAVKPQAGLFWRGSDGKSTSSRDRRAMEIPQQINYFMVPSDGPCRASMSSPLAEAR